jgi:RimJ/RimL family protein N-acetyltransferase
VGIIIGDRNYWGKGYGQDALNALVGYVSKQMKINHVHLKTLSSNERALRCFAKCGFLTYGQLVRYGQTFILMELHEAATAC